jgi:uncharacterized protein
MPSKKVRLVDVSRGKSAKSRKSQSLFGLRNLKSGTIDPKAKFGKIAGGKDKLKIEFLSSEILNRKNEEARVRYILEVVKDGTILVTDGVMSPDEELNLIRETMRRVDDGFPGIEVCSLKKDLPGFQRLVEQVAESGAKMENIINRIVGRDPVRTDLKFGMTLIGPSKYIKNIRKDPNSFSVLAGF